ncbi:MAG TPA: DUF2339 domain-containing protein [Chitinophagaceae bacterium]|nr:DUF2339 domain-containing protein [Chitinophagaceae bacterium]
MDKETQQQLENELQQLQQELYATQAKLNGLQQRLQQLQPGESELKKYNYFKTPSSSSFSLENFIGLKLIHLVGIVVLVIGLSIGVKYAIDQQLISENLRLGLAYAAGGVLFLLSWRLKKQYAAFSAILFSGAMASLYFTTYAAFVYYSLFSFPIVFVLMILLTIFTVYQALSYNRQEIAVLGLVGAYAIPFLISSNSGRAELLFTYIAFINSAVVYLAVKKSWKQVAVLAQFITWLLLAGWVLTRYTPGQQWIAYGFAGFFFLLFAAYGLAPTVWRGELLQRRQVQQLFINNLVVYVIAAAAYRAAHVLPHFVLLHAVFSMLAAAQAAVAFYLLPKQSFLARGLVLFAIGYFLLFIANRWEGFTVTLLWLVVAVIIFTIGISLKVVWLRLSGMVLMGLTLAKLVFLDSLRFTTVQKIIAYLTLGVLLLFVGFFYQRFKEKLFHNDVTNT